MTSSHNASPRTPVLIVEDEPLLRIQAIDMVEDAGFEAIVATDADRAIEILRIRPDVRIVFTDIDMPGSMDGLKLAAAVRDRWPPIEIIITSGKMIPSEIDMPARSRFFSKPFDAEHLVETMRQMAV